MFVAVVAHGSVANLADVGSGTEYDSHEPLVKGALQKAYAQHQSREVHIFEGWQRSMQHCITQQCNAPNMHVTNMSMQFFLGCLGGSIIVLSLCCVSSVAINFCEYHDFNFCSLPCSPVK